MSALTPAGQATEHTDGEDEGDGVIERVGWLPWLPPGRTQGQSPILGNYNHCLMCQLAVNSLNHDAHTAVTHTHAHTHTHTHTHTHIHS